MTIPTETLDADIRALAKRKDYGRALLRVTLRYTNEAETDALISYLEHNATGIAKARRCPGILDAAYHQYCRFWHTGE